MLRSIPALLVTVLAAMPSACGRSDPPPARELTIATGGQGGAFYPLAVDLSRLYSTRIPGVVTRLESAGSTQNVQSIEEGRARLAFTQADVAYAAYRRVNAQGSTSQLRGVAVLWMNTLHLALPRESQVVSVPELRGRRVLVGVPGSGTETLARIVLESYGMQYDDVHPEFLSFALTGEKMRRGEADAAFIVAGVPTVAVTQLAESPGLRFVPIPRDHVQTMRAQYPFLQPLLVPRGTYRGLERDVETVGVASLLVCRADLDERLVYQLTKILFQELPSLARTNASARLMDPEQAPATPIPLHPGAARYYREREITQ